MTEIRIPFKKVIPITKAYEGDDGELYIEGESSGPEFDLDKQFMTPECVKDMSDQVNANPVPVYDEHQKRGILNDLGIAIKSELTPEIHMKPTIRLDKVNPAAVTLHKKVQRGKLFGLSVAGHVLEPVKKVVNGILFQGFNRIRLDHIAVTTKPSWAPSLGTLMAKSLEQDGFDWETAPEYEGDLDLPFSAHVEKRSKPDPKAGKGYLLVEELLRKLNTAFGWESYQDKIDEENRDTIALQDIPALKPLFPVGSMKPPEKDYNEETEEWQGFIQKAVDGVAVEPSDGILDIRTLADVYERLYWLANSLARRDKTAGKKDGKKTVTRLKAAMSAIAEAMKQTLAKSQPPEPLTYGEPPEREVQPETEVTEMDRVLPDNTLTTFEDVVKTGQVPAPTAPPQPPVAGGELTDFSQVADAAEEKIAKRAELPPPVVKTIQSFQDVATNLWAAEADVGDKQKALLQLNKALAQELHDQLERERPEEDRIVKAVTEAVAPLAQEIENLRAQLAIVKTQKPVVEAEESDDPPLVRKSLPGKVVLQPARVVKSQQEAPTFLDLVRGTGGLLP